MEQLPILPLRGVVVYPLIGVTIDVGRPLSLRALLAAKEHETDLIVVTQKETGKESPEQEDLYAIGTRVHIAKMSELSNETVRVRLVGKERVKINAIDETKEGWFADVEPLELVEGEEVERTALVRLLKEQFGKLVGSIKGLSPDERRRFEMYERLESLTDYIASKLDIDVDLRQAMLEEPDAVKRGLELLEIMTHEVEIIELEQELRERTKKTIEQAQKEYYLREQMKTIQQELGDQSQDSEPNRLREKLEALDLPETTRKNVMREAERLNVVPATSPEYAVIRNYLDWVASLPWGIETEDKLDVKHAADVLDDDHYGLESVKDRILEYLAVRQLTNSLRGPILCLSGPPGVGKTSLARSIASALERHFVRVSLGGVRDEAEIRGHRRTYIGAMPGRIIRGLKQAESKNPVFLLDEIDKMASDFRDVDMHVLALIERWIDAEPLGVGTDVTIRRLCRFLHDVAEFTRQLELALAWCERHFNRERIAPERRVREARDGSNRVFRLTFPVAILRFPEIVTQFLQRDRDAFFLADGNLFRCFPAERTDDAF